MDEMTNERPRPCALVAGASGGLGSAIATELYGRGWSLTLVGRSGEGLERVAAEGHRLVADLRSLDAVRLVVHEAHTLHGRLDAVVNATGVVAFGPISELTIDTIEELFLTNTFVPMMLATAALPLMEAGSVIVNISGVVAEQNLPGMAAYGASKAAVRSFDEALAREARRRGIRVIDARPPHTETGLAARAIAGTPPRMPRGLDPSTVARVIVDAIEADVTDLPSTAFG